MISFLLKYLLISVVASRLLWSRKNTLVMKAKTKLPKNLKSVLKVHGFHLVLHLTNSSNEQGNDGGYVSPNFIPFSLYAWRFVDSRDPGVKLIICMDQGFSLNNFCFKSSFVAFFSRSYVSIRFGSMIIPLTELVLSNLDSAPHSLPCSPRIIHLNTKSTDTYFGNRLIKNCHLLGVKSSKTLFNHKEVGFPSL